METLLQALDGLAEEARLDPMLPPLWSWAPGIEVLAADPGAGRSEQDAPRSPDSCEAGELSEAVGRPLELVVEDSPRFPWRGLLVDTARHFLPVSALEHVLSAMAAAKLNVLHWHITDAVSFPLELRSLPELARGGSFGPGKTYSEADVRHLVDYASRLSIRVVPEVDMPAHTASWIFGEPQAVSNCTHVLPSDPNDRTNPFKARDKLALDVSGSRALEVARKVLRELAELFPDEFVHVGGDEVDFRCWVTMPHIRKWMQRKGFNPVGALQHFFDGVFAEVEKLGRRPMLWQDSFDQGLDLPEDAVLQPWKCWGSMGGKFVPGWPQGEPSAMSGHVAGFLAASLGLGVVQSSCWYLDWDSQWADFYEHGPDEGPLRRHDASSGAGSEEGRGATGLLGGEAALWTERIDFSNMDCRLWPRLAAVAERLWSQTSPGALPKDSISQDVAARLLRHVHRLQRLHGVSPRPLRPAANASTASADLLLEEAELGDVVGTCPLLESQAIQRSPDEPEWAASVGAAFRSDH